MVFCFFFAWIIITLTATPQLRRSPLEISLEENYYFDGLQLMNIYKKKEEQESEEQIIQTILFYYY